ncbi:hypothetical protein BON22_3320 [Cyberlindnera fabianii]|uniref:Uncharacterized protein n=1 Tax=Cyberlindnera fabianii TaxID=36022 RepID=A0A1V2L4B3_CYBFA|nr:hypothetical protein BON22_3320 [Cyberlindnera fabianii]
MAKVRIKELDSLFVLRHAQRADKLTSTVSTIDFDYSHQQLEIYDTFNPSLATFHATQNKSNNGYTQSRELGAKVLNYVNDHVEGSIVVLRFHTSPYLRCIETIKYMVDHIVKHHDDPSRQIKIIINIDHVLSEWLNTELDVNYYPPNDNGATLLSTAIQYLNSNIPFNRNDNVTIRLNLNDTYAHGNPGPFSESFMQQYTRLNRGIISIVKDAQNNLSAGQDTKDILLIMTHGACVRSILSKLLGKSLMAEIPLASATIAKPHGSDSKHYYWKVEETDIDLRNNIQVFKPVDLYSSRDPFQDIQTTFDHSTSSQLDFKSGIPPSKTENFNRIRFNLYLTRESLIMILILMRIQMMKESVLKFTHLVVHNHLMVINKQEDFRSTSLFGPVLKNPFFEEQRNSTSRKNSFERVKASLRREEEFISPTENHLAELSSNNSSSNSLHEDSQHKTPSPTVVPTTQLNKTEMEMSPSPQPVQSESTMADPSSSVSLSTLKPSSTSLFDKSLIEESLNEINNEKTSTPTSTTLKSDWMNFKDTSAGSGLIDNGSSKFKIDLYGKKNRMYKLSLYDHDDDDDDDDEGDHGGWFLGSNRY